MPLKLCSRVNHQLFVYNETFFCSTKICPRTHFSSLKSFGSVVCSLEAPKISEYCRRTRRLPYKLIFFTFPREQTTEPNDFREEKCVLEHILVEQKKFKCKQTAEGLLYYTCL